MSVLLGACGGDAQRHGDLEGPAPRSWTTVPDLAARWPAAAALLAGRAPSPAQPARSGSERVLRISSPAPRAADDPPAIAAAAGASPLRGKTAARGATVEIPDDGSGRIFAGMTGSSLPVKARRAGASGARPVIEDGAVVIRGAAPGVDAVFTAAEGGVEELLIVESARAEIGYDFDLPSGSRLRRSEALPGAVEVVRRSGAPALRIVVDRAWDAEGREIEPAVTVDGARLRVSLPAGATYPVAVDPAWISPTHTAVLRSRHTATLLGDGKVLVTGGHAAGAGDTAELYDPVTGTFTLIEKSMTALRSRHTATLLPDGRVLLIGGEHDPSEAARSTELYDPQKGSFEPGPDMATQREGHTATLLSSGDVLVAGGSGEATSRTTAEIYRLKSGVFEPPINMAHGRESHTATRLADGRVLLRGDDSMEVYDPSSGVKSPFSDVAGEHLYRAQHTATLLAEDADGKAPLLLFCGGKTMDISGKQKPADDCELFDLDAEVSAAVHLAGQRYQHTASLLPGGEVLLAGGSPNSASASAEAYTSPQDQTLAISQPMLHLHTEPTSTVLPDGSLFVLGGGAPDIYEVAKWTSTTKNPHYLFWGAVPLHSGKILLLGQSVAFVYDPASGGLSSPVTGFENITSAGAAVRLDDGTVLLLTGSGQWPALVYDPSAAPGVLTGLPWPRARMRVTATLLPGGRVLVAGGKDAAGVTEGSAVAEIYDPVTREFTLTGDLHYPRVGHTSTRLEDGRVLVAGGHGQGAGATADVYDPTTGLFTLVKMKTAMDDHAAAVLPDGRVLLVDYDLAQIFDPDAFEVTYSNATGLGSQSYRAVALPSGKLLLLGVIATQLYDPLLDQAVTLQPSEYTAWAAATLLPSGDVLGACGAECTTPELGLWHNTAIRDAPRPRVTAVGSSGSPAIVRPGDRVKLTGTGLSALSEGASGTTGASAADHPIAVWMPWPEGTPSTGSITGWAQGSSEATWTVPRTRYPGLGLLFVVVGGVPSDGAPVIIKGISTAGACGSSSECESGFCVEGVCCDRACDGACESCKGALNGGADGVCGLLPAGDVEHNRCQKTDLTDPLFCARIVVCNEEGHCAAPPDGTPCNASGAHCLQGVCSEECFTNADCAEGLVCSARPDDGPRTCQPPIKQGSGNDCSAAPGREASAGAPAAAFLALLLASRRRKRPRPGAGARPW